MFYVAPAVLDTRDASDVALPLQDLTVLWMTKKRERGNRRATAIPALRHTDSDHCDAWHTACAQQWLCVKGWVKLLLLTRWLLPRFLRGGLSGSGRVNNSPRSQRQ